MDLTNEQWVVLEPLIGEMPRRADGRGRPWRESGYERYAANFLGFVHLGCILILLKRYL